MKNDYRDLTAPFGVERQMAIPVHLPGGGLSAFVVARSRSDFSEADVAYSAMLAPLLAVVLRQYDVLGGLDQTLLRQSLLTPREHAVLVLLATGCTALSMSNRLSISPGTVRKHLEHVYRKLGVSDRMTAVLRAQEQGLLPATMPSQSADRWPIR